MAKKLEDLQPGAPVRCEDGPEAGEVRGVYTTGDSRMPEFLGVRWLGGADEILVPTDQVLRIDGGTAVLSGSQSSYDDSVAFDPAANPLVHRLR